MDRATLIADLTRDEADRSFAYDDATGYKILPGNTVKGNVTIGIGRCLTTNGITEEESLYLLNHDIDAVQAKLAATLPLFSALDDSRQRALINMAFNMGVYGVLGFKEMLVSLQAGDYATAAAQILSSKWAKEVGNRAVRVAELIKG